MCRFKLALITGEDTVAIMSIQKIEWLDRAKYKPVAPHLKSKNIL